MKGKRIVRAQVPRPLTKEQASPAALHDGSASNQFGFTNDDAHLANVRDFVAAAVADGWSIAPTYASEPVEAAAKFSKDGFVGSALMRIHAPGGRWKYEAIVHLWGPDGLAIKPPFPYDLNLIKAGLRRCSACKTEDVETERYSFAGRCCAGCLPKMRALHEQPGWTN